MTEQPNGLDVSQMIEALEVEAGKLRQAGDARATDLRSLEENIRSLQEHKQTRVQREAQALRVERSRESRRNEAHSAIALLDRLLTERSKLYVALDNGSLSAAKAVEARHSLALLKSRICHARDALRERLAAAEFAQGVYRDEELIRQLQTATSPRYLPEGAKSRAFIVRTVTLYYRDLAIRARIRLKKRLGAMNAAQEANLAKESRRVGLQIDDKQDRIRRALVAAEAETDPAVRDEDLIQLLRSALDRASKTLLRYGKDARTAPVLIEQLELDLVRRDELLALLAAGGLNHDEIASARFELSWIRRHTYRIRKAIDAMIETAATLGPGSLSRKEHWLLRKLREVVVADYDPRKVQD